MVGGRRQQLNALTANGSGNHEAGHHGNKHYPNGWYKDDLETGRRSPSRKFRDAINQTIVHNRSNELKRKILDGIDRSTLR